MAKGLSKRELKLKGFPYIEYEKNGLKGERVFYSNAARDAVIKLLINQGYTITLIK